MLRVSLSIPSRCRELDRRCQANRASAPGFPAPRPGSCKAFCDQLVANGATVAHQDPQLAAVLIFIPIADRNGGEFSLIKQNHQSVSRLDAELVFGVTFRLRDFRRINVRNPDLHAFQPDGIAIDNAGPPDHAAHCEAVRGSGFRARWTKWPIDTDKAPKNTNEQTHYNKKRKTLPPLAFVPGKLGPEIEHIIEVWSFTGHETFPDMRPSFIFRDRGQDGALVFSMIFGYFLWEKMIRN